MTNNVINELAEHDIYSYGSTKLKKFEKQMAKFFEREYKHWENNAEHPEIYGISSFKGSMTKPETHDESVDHYNKDLQVYQSFLDKDYLAYTMAYYGATEEHADFHEILLSQAQVEKFKLIIQRADIKDNQTVLDLGCGFGGFSKYLLETFPNIQITGINPSKVQAKYLKNLFVPYGNRFTLIDKYLNDISESEISKNSFDRVVSIGVLEHFSNFDLLFKYLETILKPGGKCLHHLIVSSDTVPQFLNAESTLISDYFPGGYIWPHSELQRHDKHLRLTQSWFVNGLNYWKTLDEWHKNFWDEIDQLYPKYLSKEDVDSWNKYFSLCKSVFLPNQGKSCGNGQYLYIKN